MRDIVADLHVHTTLSDGRLDPGEVPAAARTAGLDCVAVTDHDRHQPWLDAPVVERGGVTVVHGIELRVDAGDQRLDLLGYGVDPTPELASEVTRLQRDRERRAAEMVARIEERLDVALDLDLNPGVGRPHIARAVAESEASYDYQGAFDHLIGDDGPCYVPRDVPGLDRGVDVLRGACALVGLAHPFRYGDVDAALDAAADLDALERYYPYAGPVATDRLDRALEEHDLVATGGSDAHDARLGRAGLDRGGYAAVADRLPGAQA